MRFSTLLTTGLVGLLLGAASAAALFFATKAPETAALVSVTRGSIAEEVVVTGRVVSPSEVSLAFDRTGKISGVYVSVGDRVAKGIGLIRMEATDTYANYLKALASVKSARAMLAELKRGTRAEELRVEEFTVEHAMRESDNARLSLIEVTRAAFTVADDALHLKIDQMFSNPRSAASKLVFWPADGELRMKIEDERLALESDFSRWQENLLTLIEQGQVVDAAEETKRVLGKISILLNGLAQTLLTATLPPGISPSTLVTWKAEVNGARTSIDGARANTITAEGVARRAESGLALEKQKLTLLRAGETDETLAVEEAKVEEAEAAVLVYKAALERAIIRAPINGVIVRQDKKLGEIAAAGEAVVSLIDQNDFQIEATVPEIDIGRINVRNTVAVTFDTYPGQVFLGSVLAIEPAETIIDGVIYFKIIVGLVAPRPLLRSGLTANLTITGQTRNNVLLLPQTTILERDDGMFVKKIVSGAGVAVPISIGLRGGDGNVEILKGLSEGDEVEVVAFQSDGKNREK